MDERVVMLLASISENSEDGFRRWAVWGRKGVLNLRVWACFVVQSYSLKQFLLWASKDDVDYLPMAKPLCNNSFGDPLPLPDMSIVNSSGMRSGVVQSSHWKAIWGSP